MKVVDKPPHWENPDISALCGTESVQYVGILSFLRCLTQALV